MHKFNQQNTPPNYYKTTEKQNNHWFKGLQEKNYPIQRFTIHLTKYTPYKAITEDVRISSSPCLKTLKWTEPRSLPQACWDKQFASSLWLDVIKVF